MLIAASLRAKPQPNDHQFTIVLLLGPHVMATQCAVQKATSQRWAQTVWPPSLSCLYLHCVVAGQTLTP